MKFKTRVQNLDLPQSCSSCAQKFTISVTLKLTIFHLLHNLDRYPDFPKKHSIYYLFKVWGIIKSIHRTVAVQWYLDYNSSILNIGASLPSAWLRPCWHSDLVQALSGRTRGDPITNTNMEVRDSEGPQHQRSSLVDRAVNGPDFTMPG